jgi:hypothetical protein
LAQRQEQLDSASSKSSAPTLPKVRRSDRSGMFLEKIKEFFSLRADRHP